VKAPRDPEELEVAGAPATAKIAPETRLGTVELTVADLDRSVAYYEQAIGLRVVERDAGRVSLGAGDSALLELTELPGARPADGYSGLFHVALLLPQRADLARWLAHAARERVALTGASDHFVSEAIYLRDPDHHGIEIYWDRPRKLWEGQVNRMGTWPLDVQGVLSELSDAEEAAFEGLAAGTAIGHIHLRVAEIEPVVAFYRDALGFALMAQLGPEAAFLSAGGYHHHVGANVWESSGAGQAPPGSATLVRWTIVLPSEQERMRVVERLGEVGESDGLLLAHDPSGNALALAVA
jgi:catechol 2,3-dioxygenase